MRIYLFFLLSIFISGNSIAEMLFPVYKVSIVIKSGEVKTGYILGLSYSALKFNPDDFLKYYQKLNEENEVDVELYKNIYTINDGGYYGGLATVKSELEKISFNKIKKIEPLKNSYEGQSFTTITNLSKDKVEMMQSKLLYMDHINSKVNACITAAFNYNPNVSRKEVHHLLLEWDKIFPDEWKIDENGVVWKKIIGSKKVVVNEVCYDE